MLDPRTGYPMAMNDTPTGSRAAMPGGVLLPVLLAVLGTLLALSAPAGAAVIRGGDGDDRLSGTAQADSIRTFGGHDRVFALQGPDIVSGGDGNDRLKGGPGADVLNGQAGADRLVAGSDDAVDELHGGPADDVLFLVAADRGFADAGDDTIYATDAVQATEIQCGDGDDTVVLTDPDPLVTFHDCEHVREEPAGRPVRVMRAAAG
jgi:Ca2+-binding RTX toxin-like protein